MRYSIEPRDRKYVKGYRFLSFAKNMGKNLSNKYGQKLLDSANKIYSRRKSTNLLDNEVALSASNQPSKFRTRNWVKINDESRRYISNDIRFKTTMLRSNLCDYADAYILVNGRITITRAGDDDAARQANERYKGVTFKNCASFTKCLSRLRYY